MDRTTQANVYQIIIETLEELGMDDVESSITETPTLIQNGRHAGRSFACGHVRILMRSGGKRIEFSDENGRMIRAVFLPSSFVGQAAAA